MFVTSGHGAGAVGVEPDHLTAGGVGVVLSISTDKAEFKRSTYQLWLSFHRFCF